jgi:C_GCAxxG_C_C family probable redox protein
MMSRAEAAATNIASRKMNCSQSVLTAFCTELGLERKLALKVALGFGGGMGRCGGTCGAVTGAYMVLGLKQDLKEENAGQAKEKAYALVKQFNYRFIALNGTLLCRELLGCDLGTPEGHELATQKNLFTTLCPKYVRAAVEILEAMDL